MITINQYPIEYWNLITWTSRLRKIWQLWLHNIIRCCKTTFNCVKIQVGKTKELIPFPYTSSTYIIAKITMSSITGHRKLSYNIYIFVPRNLYNIQLGRVIFKSPAQLLPYHDTAPPVCSFCFLLSNEVVQFHFCVQCCWTYYELP